MPVELTGRNRKINLKLFKRTEKLLQFEESLTVLAVLSK